VRLVLVVVVIAALVASGGYLAFGGRGGAGGSQTTLSAYSGNRELLSKALLANYNSTYQLLDNANVGACGTQENGFSLIDENLFGGTALQEYSPVVGNAILGSMRSHLGSVGYDGDDRREVLFGSPIAFPPLQTVDVTVAGTAPPTGCVKKTAFWIVTEIPTNASKIYNQQMNYIVPALLEKFREGDRGTAESLFNTALGWWDGKGFMSPAVAPLGYFNTRDICYFLFAQKATGFPVDAGTLGAIQAQLWSLQFPQFDGGLVTSYSFSGGALGGGGHTSNEINGLCLLAYDPRIQTQWWPAPSTTQGVAGMIFGVAQQEAVQEPAAESAAGV
jgi:hypothetical protein